MLCFILHARLRVHLASGIPCALFIEGVREIPAKLGRVASRDRGSVSREWRGEQQVAPSSICYSPRPIRCPNPPFRPRSAGIFTIQPRLVCNNPLHGAIANPSRGGRDIRAFGAGGLRGGGADRAALHVS